MLFRVFLALVLLWDIPLVQAEGFGEAVTPGSEAAESTPVSPQRLNVPSLEQTSPLTAPIALPQTGVQLNLPLQLQRQTAPAPIVAPGSQSEGVAAQAVPELGSTASEPAAEIAQAPAAGTLERFHRRQEAAPEPAAQEAALNALFNNDGRASDGAAVIAPQPSIAEGKAAPTTSPVPNRPPSPPPAPGSNGDGPHNGSGKSKIISALPNLVTGLNLISGVAAIVQVMHGAYLPAAACILAGNIFDALDGRTARALHVESPIGLQLDSLADVVSFGVAPAMLIYQAALAPLGIFGFAVAGLYAFAGAYRLARFNVGAAKAHDGPSENFTGLPIPGGAGVIVALSLVLGAVPAAHIAAVSSAATLLTAAAMVSTLPYPTFKKGGSKALLAPALLGGAAAAGLSAFGLYRLIPAAIFGMYLLSGPLRRLFETSTDSFRAELKRKTFHQGMLVYLGVYHLLGPTHAAYALMGWVPAMGLIETLRLRSQSVRAFIEDRIGFLIRPKEANRYTAAFYGSVGILSAALIAGAHPWIVTAAILNLSFGDTASALVGMRWGTHKYQLWGSTRSLEGTAAGFATALGVGFALGLTPGMTLVSAGAFLLADVLPLPPDDNFWIPALTAAALAFASHL